MPDHEELKEQILTDLQQRENDPTRFDPGAVRDATVQVMKAFEALALSALSAEEIEARRQNELDQDEA